MKGWISYILFLVVFVSCAKKETEFENQIKNDFWIFSLDKLNKDSSYSICTRFDCHRKLMIDYGFDSSGEPDSTNRDYWAYSETKWDFKQIDSLFIMKFPKDEWRFKYLKIQDDTIYLRVIRIGSNLKQEGDLIYLFRYTKNRNPKVVSEGHISFD